MTEGMPTIKPIVVACRCGWQGEQRDLVTTKLKDDRYCPACARPFQRVPSYRDDPRSAKDILSDGWPDPQ